MAKPDPATVTMAKVENGGYLLAAILTKEQVVALIELMEPVSRSWRGQYQSMAKAVVEAATAVLGDTAKEG